MLVWLGYLILYLFSIFWAITLISWRINVTLLLTSFDKWFLAYSDNPTFESYLSWEGFKELTFFSISLINSRVMLYGTGNRKSWLLSRMFLISLWRSESGLIPSWELIIDVTCCFIFSYLWISGINLETTKTQDSAILAKFWPNSVSILVITSTKVDPRLSWREESSTTITNLKELFLLKIKELEKELMTSWREPFVSNIPGKSIKFIPGFL